MKKHITYIAAFLLTGSVLKAQDFHVSQYDVATMYLNPALTGMYGDEKGDYRAYVDTRSQWRAFGVKPFFTTYLAYDMPYTIKDKKVGFGAYFINNRTGPGNFNTTGFMLSGAYNILFAKCSTGARGSHYDKNRTGRTGRPVSIHDDFEWIAAFASTRNVPACQGSASSGGTRRPGESTEAA